MSLDYNSLLYEKMANEYDDFLKQTAALPPEQILDHAYEKVMKEDILSLCEECNLEQKEAKALYKSKCPLDKVYQEWLHNDFTYMDMLRDTLDTSAEKSVKEMQSQSRESR